MIRLSLAAAAVVLLTGPVLAEEEFGTLNPEEMTINRVLQDAAEGKTSMTMCASGYYITKAGRHVQARALFEACAKNGYTGAM